MAITLRPATVNDADFCNRLARDVMMPYVQQTWQNPEDIDEYFQLNQFDLATTQIIQRHFIDIGRLSLTEAENHIKIDNIHIAAACQGQGIGTMIVNQLITRSVQSNIPLILNVLESNPAVRLYQRLGFEIESSAHHRLRMKRLPKSLLNRQAV